MPNHQHTTLSLVRHYTSQGMFEYFDQTGFVHQSRGLVKFKQQRIQLDLPKGTYVVVLREGQDYLFSLGDQVVFCMTGQEKCHPCI